MNLTCTGVPASEAGELRDRLLDGDQVGDDVDRLGPLGVGVRPARELVQVVADAHYLYGALTLDGDRRRGPRPRAGHGLSQQVGKRHAGRLGLGQPVGALGGRHAGGGEHGAALRHRRAPARGNGGRPPPAGPAGRRDAGGSKGGAQRPLASPMYNIG